MRNVRASMAAPFVLEVLAGVAGAVAGGLSGGLLSVWGGEFACSVWRQSWSWCANGSWEWNALYWGLAVGAAIGVAAGVSIAGWRLKAKGNVWLALLGAIGGTISAVAIIIGVAELYNSHLQGTADLLGFWLGVIFFVASPAIGATVGYNVRRVADIQLSPEGRYDIHSQRATQLIDQKKLTEAIRVYQQMMDEFPEWAEEPERCIKVLNERIAKGQ